MDKRTFLKSATLASIGALTGIPANAMTDYTPLAEAAGSDEAYWKMVRKGYVLKPGIINLENGYYCVQPQEILDKYIEHIKEVNLQGAYYMRTVQFDNKLAAARQVAELAGCTADELIITRNTTESLDMIIAGLDWKAGDEAVMASHDYGAMLDMFAQVAKRYGTVNKIVEVPLHPKTDDEIVNLYANAITPRTKLLMVCHIINITGQVLPVRKICDMAHSKGVRVMVDGAHAFAHLQYSIPDLHCDYYGASMHKWLSVPIGAGFLYIKQEHIPHVWPLLAEAGKADNDVLRLNHTGTHPPATDLTIADAIDYYKRLGPARKEERLRYLQQYWTTKVQGVRGINLYTPADAARSCAIANVGIEGMKPADMAATLLNKYNIYTVAIDRGIVQGCRITPNIYTTIAELDALVNALKQMAAATGR